ncbi:hypothetical protein BDN67DRAFT_967600 [Paxillus ammoniavirescens]|nr:hypothetical protein BDN67DRAFT_967600 [Paxillus ammoniavirescens]
MASVSLIVIAVVIVLKGAFALSIYTHAASHSSSILGLGETQRDFERRNLGDNTRDLSATPEYT